LKRNVVRVCISLDEEIYKKLREIQAFLIKETNSNVSFSKVISDVTDVGLQDKRFSDVVKILIEENKIKYQ